MSAFPRIGGELRVGEHSPVALAAEFGTPLYLYDAQEIDRRVAGFRAAFASVELHLAYAVKANGSLAILNRLAGLGVGADIVSGGELARALRAGIPADRILFAGVAKTPEEISQALEAGIRAFNVESAPELERIARIAGEGRRIAPIAIRVNPDVASGTHPYTATGHAGTKFGVPAEEAFQLYREAQDHPFLDPVGIDLHIGSQIEVPEPFVAALERVGALVERLRAVGIELDFLDLGGGLAVGYGEGGLPARSVDREEGLAPERLAAAILPQLRRLGLRLVLEPGRAIVGSAGILLTRVEYLKRTPERTFVIVDGGMTDLLRPSHYGGYHHIEPVRDSDGSSPVERVDVVGPICETGDFLARDRELVLPRPGELLAVHTAGAYGFVMASNYNARRRPAEVMVDGDRVELIRRREELEDLWRGERIP